MPDQAPSTDEMRANSERVRAILERRLSEKEAESPSVAREEAIAALSAAIAKIESVWQPTAQA